MQQVIGDFIHALRQAGLPVSPAETLDAVNTASLVGLDNRLVLKTALGLTVAKTQENKLQYDHVFDQFFHFAAQDMAAQETDDALEQDGTDISTAEPLISENSNQDSSLVDGSSLVEDSPLADTLQSPLAQQLMQGDQAAMSVAIAGAGNAVGVNQMQMFTQKPLFTFRIMQQMGMDALNQELRELSQQEENQSLVQLLKTRRNLLREQVQDFVEQQYALFAQAEGKKLRDSNLQKVRFTLVDYQSYDRMTGLVRKAAKQLASLHSRRRKVTKRGMLDVRKTIAANAAYDGVLFHTKWKSTRIDRPKIVAICDVSGSVSRVARFLLLFLYSLQDVLPRVRSFVFSGAMGEVTEYFEQDDLETAMTKVMEGWANRSTDYAMALSDFENLALDDIDNKTTVIMLGDARNNNGDGNVKVWEQVYRRSNRVLWLNPEGRGSWDTGDSIMADYAPYCTQVESCNSLRDLTRILSGLLKNS